MRRDGGKFDRMISDFRTSDKIRAFVDAANVDDIAKRGVSTPDLVIRIKTGPMVLPAPDATPVDGLWRRHPRARGGLCRKLHRLFRDE